MKPKATPTMVDAEQQMPLQDMPITQHLIILRQHLIKIIGLLIVLFFCLLPFANQSYQWLSEPLRAQLPVSSSMIATDVTATFMAPFKLNFFMALMIAMPFILYQLWAFVKPALYQREKTWLYHYCSAVSECFMPGLLSPISSPCPPFCTFLSVFPLTRLHR